MSVYRHDERILVISGKLVATSIDNIFCKMKEKQCFKYGPNFFLVTNILVIHIDISMVQLFITLSFIKYSKES